MRFFQLPVLELARCVACFLRRRLLLPVEFFFCTIRYLLQQLVELFFCPPAFSRVPQKKTSRGGVDAAQRTSDGQCTEQDAATVVNWRANHSTDKECRT
jgi:hypothetical protein